MSLHLPEEGTMQPIQLSVDSDENVLPLTIVGSVVDELYNATNPLKDA
tara:strand:+ start:531 stop:674 length:144 start_codon:yes stop_codon:yes gene_type:complete